MISDRNEANHEQRNAISKCIIVVEFENGMELPETKRQSKLPHADQVAAIPSTKETFLGK